jgi:hypothetical protein
MFDPMLRAAVWQRWEEEKPGPGAGYADWVQRMAEESGAKPGTIRRIIAEGSSVYLQQLTRQTQTAAQQTADLIGASLVEALETLRRGLYAKKQRPLLDKSGRPKKIDEEKGYTPDNLFMVETDDVPTQLTAARTLIEVHGARAPQQIEVAQQIVTVEISAEDALAQLAETSERLARLRHLISSGSTGVKAITAGGAEAEGIAGAA